MENIETWIDLGSIVLTIATAILLGISATLSIHSKKRRKLSLLESELNDLNDKQERILRKIKSDQLRIKELRIKIEAMQRKSPSRTLRTAQKLKAAQRSELVINWYSEVKEDLITANHALLERYCLVLTSDTFDETVVASAAQRGKYCIEAISLLAPQDLTELSSLNVLITGMLDASNNAQVILDADLSETNVVTPFDDKRVAITLANKAGKLMSHDGAPEGLVLASRAVSILKSLGIDEHRDNYVLAESIRMQCMIRMARWKERALLTSEKLYTYVQTYYLEESDYRMHVEVLHGQFLSSSEKLNEAEIILEKSLQKLKKWDGENSDSTLFVTHELASLHCEKREYHDALDFACEAFCKRIVHPKYGNNHIHTYDSQILVARIMRITGSFRAALPLAFHAWLYKISCLGRYHSSTLFAQFELASCYHDLSFSHIALALIEELIDRRKSSFDSWAGAAETAESYRLQMEILTKIGQLDKAREVLEPLLHYYHAEIGPHRKYEAICTVAELVEQFLYENESQNGYLDTAEDIICRLLRYCKDVDTPVPLIVSQHYAHLYMLRENFVKAEELERNVLCKILSDNNRPRETLRASAFRLANILIQKTSLSEALWLARFAAFGELCDPQRGPEHSSTHAAISTYKKALDLLGYDDELRSLRLTIGELKQLNKLPQ